MLKNNRKILITIVLTAIFVLIAGVVSAELKLEASKLSTPESNIGNEITLNAVIENTGALSVSGINLVIRTDSGTICSKTGLIIPGKNKTIVPCPWKITGNVSCGENSIYMNVNGGGQSLSKSMIVNVNGKHYAMLLEPDTLELDKAFKVIIKDESGNGIEGAKISLSGVFSVPGGYEKDVPVDIGEIYTKSGQASLTITKAGKYKIIVEHEKEFYCKSVYREREVMNTFIVYGLKNAYSLDDEFNIRVTDKDNSTIDVVIEFRGPVTREYYKENIPFNFRNKGFSQGTYDLFIKEETDDFGEVPERYHRISQKITLSAGKSIPTPAANTPNTVTPAKPASPPLKIEISPDVDILKKGDKITIYVKSGGKGIDGVSVKVSTAFGGIKDFKTSGGGKVDYTIEKNDFFSIHAEKEGYASADISFDLMEDKDKTTPSGSSGNASETQENTSSGSEETKTKTNSTVTESKTSGVNEMKTSGEDTTFKKAEITDLEKSSPSDGMDYNSILVICGIIIVLLVIIVLVICIWKLVR